MPHELTEQNYRKSQKAELRRQKNEAKPMYCIFFTTTGPVRYYNIFKQGVTINNKSFKFYRLFLLVAA